jgi:hypothetical protein
MIASSNRGALFLQTINSATGTGKAVSAGAEIATPDNSLGIYQLRFRLD